MVTGHAPDPKEAAVYLDHATAARTKVQAIYVLRNQKETVFEMRLD